MSRRAAPLLAAALLLAACGTEDTTDDTAETAAETAAAETATMECVLPSELPADLPLPPDCTWVFDPTDIQGQYLIVSTRSSAPQDEVVAFFEEELPTGGWEITTRDDRQDGGMSLAIQREEERLFLEIYPSSGEEGGLTVQYVLR